MGARVCSPFAPLVPNRGDQLINKLTDYAVDVVQLVFDHGIIEARRDDLQLLASRLITRFDEVSS